MEAFLLMKVEYGILPFEKIAELKRLSDLLFFFSKASHKF
jgi:hypothetical protein